MDEYKKINKTKRTFWAETEKEEGITKTDSYGRF